MKTYCNIFYLNIAVFVAQQALQKAEKNQRFLYESALVIQTFISESSL